MKTMKKWIMLGALISIAVAPAASLATRESPECRSVGARLFDCCQAAEDDEAACCTRCCWLPRGCGDCLASAATATGAS